MPTLSNYLRLAPFTLEELVDAANSVLRDRPKLHVTKRTVRYYVAERIVPPPVGSPKNARYGAEHLIRLVGARALADIGRSLPAVRTELDRLTARNSEATAEIQALLDDMVVLEAPLRSPLASFLSLPDEDDLVVPDVLVRRVPLGRLVLEGPGAMSADEIRQEALRELS